MKNMEILEKANTARTLYFNYQNTNKSACSLGFSLHRFICEIFVLKLTESLCDYYKNFTNECAKRPGKYMWFGLLS
jgi:hypothetical protein